MITPCHRAIAELIFSAKPASPPPAAASTVARQYRLPGGNNNDQPIADRL
jgi:hypothetical protein